MSRTGWRSSRFDGRAWQTADVQWKDAGKIESPYEPLDQGEAKCCVGAVITAAMEILDNHDGSAVRLSPLFSYYTSRLRPQATTGNVALDTGLYAAATKGVCTFAAHEQHHGLVPPFDTQAALIPPTLTAQQEAERRRLIGYDTTTQRMAYYEVSGGDVAREWARAVQAGHPVAFGFVPSGVYRALSPTAYVVTDVGRERGSPGHAALVVGYADGRFRVRDSRGTGFADQGYWEVTEAVVQTRWIAESWVITKVAYDD